MNQKEKKIRDQWTETSKPFWFDEYSSRNYNRAVRDRHTPAHKKAKYLKRIWSILEHESR